jgi:hypothetical protein
MRKAMLAVLSVALGAGPVWAQEAGTEPEGSGQRERPLRTLRVLQSPYDLASFYSARPGAPGVTPPVPDDPAYALASFYRSRQSGPSARGPWLWAPFWAYGYGTPRPAPLVGYRHRIGENGDLFLAVPFLAPVGPLSGAFPGF